MSEVKHCPECGAELEGRLISEICPELSADQARWMVLEDRMAGVGLEMEICLCPNGCVPPRREVDGE